MGTAKNGLITGWLMDCRFNKTKHRPFSFIATIGIGIIHNLNKQLLV
jgi:hypothetical protein